jgi:hypothetical protein
MISFSSSTYFDDCINICTAVGERIVVLSATKHLGPHMRSFALLRMTMGKRMTNVEVAQVLLRVSPKMETG